MATINLFGERLSYMVDDFKDDCICSDIPLLHCLCEGYASHVFPPLLHQRQEDNSWHNLFNTVTQFYYRMFDSF